METETKTLTVRESQQGEHTIVQRGAWEHVVLSRESLQRLAQYAYDRHGIVADPSYATESYTAELARRAAEASERSPYCRCGMDHCSDRHMVGRVEL